MAKKPAIGPRAVDEESKRGATQKQAHGKKKPVVASDVESSGTDSEYIRENGADSDQDEDELSQEEKELEDAVKDLPFEVLGNVLSDGRQGRPGVAAEKALRSKDGGAPHTSKRLNKNRPMEMPSNRPVPRLRQVVDAPKKEVRDPRFESLCGKFDESRFEKQYGFLYSETIPKEKEQLSRTLRKEKQPERRLEIERAISKIDNQLRSLEAKRRHRQVVAAAKKKEREEVAKGKKPFYPKKSEIRKLELKEKFEELKQSGKLESYLTKRRKKNAAKDHRYMPYRKEAPV